MVLFNRYWPGLLLILWVSSASARPEVIRPDVSYYSDDYVQQGVVRDIEIEKNYEEIYQFYTYYEVIYDSSERVRVFREYKRGSVIHEEHYRYEKDSVMRTLVPKSPLQ